MCSYNRGIKSIEGKKTSVQRPLGRKQFNVNIATEMEMAQINALFAPYSHLSPIKVNINPYAK